MTSDSLLDPAEHVAQASACLPRLSSADAVALALSDGALELPATPVTAPAPPDPAPADARASERELGCAISAGEPTAALAWLALPLVAGLTRRRRRLDEAPEPELERYS